MNSEVFPVESLHGTQPVLVLGGAGFIGTRLTALLLEQGQAVRIGDLQPSKSYPELSTECDVRNRATLTGVSQGVAAIVNLAAEHRDDVRPASRYTETNVEGAREVCEAARLAGVSKLVFTSSVAVYGFHARVVDESGPFEPFHDYGRTKLAAEAVYRAWAEEDPARTLVIVRPTVVFGEGNRGNVYNLLRQIVSGRFVMVGEGANRKSMAYVGNIAAFLAHSLTLGPGIHIANYVDKPDLCTRDLVTLIRQSLGQTGGVLRLPLGLAMAIGHGFDAVARITGRRFPISALRVRKFTESTQFAADRVTALEFRAPYTLAEGLERTIHAEFAAGSSADAAEGEPGRV